MIKTPARHYRTFSVKSFTAEDTDKQVRVGNEKNCLSLTFVVKFIAWNLFFFTFWDIAIINKIFHIFTLEIKGFTFLCFSDLTTLEKNTSFADFNAGILSSKFLTFCRPKLEKFSSCKCCHFLLFLLVPEGST